MATKLGRGSLAKEAEKDRVIEEIATEKVDDDNGGVTGVEVGGDTEWWVRGVWGWLAAGGVHDWRGERGERGEGGSKRGERWAWLRGELTGEPLGEPFRGPASEGSFSRSFVSIRSPVKKTQRLIEITVFLELHSLTGLEIKYNHRQTHCFDNAPHLMYYRYCIPLLV